jgi:hypothetical protein
MGDRMIQQTHDAIVFGPGVRDEYVADNKDQALATLWTFGFMNKVQNRLR